jgi:serine/threonine-protein kinase
LRRPTAVKLLLPENAGDKYLRRFEHEVRMTARLSHPNTITVFDFGRTADGTFYYAMELLDGADLEEIVTASGPQPAERVVHVLCCVAGALAEAHGIGLIHRDIKPSNIMLCAQGGSFDTPKVLDFGLVRSVDTDIWTSGADTIVGTPLYLAPEGITDPGRVDGRTDLYALGAVGYFLLTGQPVFDGKTVAEVCQQHLDVAPIPPSVRLGAPVPPALEAIVLACLEKAAADRPESALELRDRLRKCPDVGEWEGDAARKWWDQYGPAIVVARGAERSGTSLTFMPVDASDGTPTGE